MADEQEQDPAKPDDKAAARAKRLEEVQEKINELVKEREALMSGEDAE